jgi:putative DNA primase/helicase
MSTPSQTLSTAQQVPASLTELRDLIFGLIDEMPEADSEDLSAEFRFRYKHLAEERWNKKAADSTLWLENQIKRALAKRAPVTKSLLDWALEHVSRGWFVFPCVPRGKEPATANGVLDASNDPSVIKAWWAKNPDFNPAIALGPSNLTVCDYDLIAPPATATTLRVRTGRIQEEGAPGGYHDIYSGTTKTRSIFIDAVEPIVEKDDVDSKGAAVKVRYDALGRKVGKKGVAVGEIRSRGSYIIAPGAVHKSGNVYTIINDLPLAASPEQVPDTPYDSGNAAGTEEQNTIAAFLEKAFDESGVAYKTRETYSGGLKWLVDCPWTYMHSSGKTLENGGSSSAVIMLPSGALSYKCQHAHCEDFVWSELRGWMEESAGKKLQFGPTNVVTVTIDGQEPSKVPSQASSSISNQSSAPVSENAFTQEPPKEEEPEDVNDWAAPDITNRPGEVIEFRFPQTDMARLTLQTYGKNITYVVINEKGWWKWFNGKIWVDCDKATIREFIRKASGYISTKIIPTIRLDDYDNEEVYKKRRKWFLNLVGSCNDSSFTEKVMIWMQENRTKLEVFDDKSMLFNFNNGTYDFDSGVFRKFEPADYLTQASPVNYNPNALCPTFDLMMENAFDNPEMRRFMLRYMGYCMLGISPEKVFVLAHGNGDNGKTVIAEILKAVLGNYAQCAEWDSFSVNRSGSIRNDIACLWNARFVYCDEGEHDVKIAAGKLKALSGSGSMKARFLNKEFFTFLIKFKMMLIANIRPKLPSADQALWSRVLDIHMKHDYREGHPKRIDKLKAKLWDEREGIMAKMVKAAHEYLKNGLNPPDEIRASTESYRNAIDPLQSFFQSCCHFEPNAFTSKQALYDAYETRCHFNKEYTMAETVLAERLRAMGVVESATHNPRGWLGIKLVWDGKPSNRQFLVGTSPQHPGGQMFSDDTPVNC